MCVCVKQIYIQHLNNYGFLSSYLLLQWGMYYLCGPCPPCLLCYGLKLSLTWSLSSSSNSAPPPCLCSPRLLFLDPVSPYTLMNWHWKGLPKFFVLLSPPAWLTFSAGKSYEVCTWEIGRISNFKPFNLRLFNRSKLEREMWFDHDHVVASPAKWQLVADPLAQARPSSRPVWASATWRCTTWVGLLKGGVYASKGRREFNQQSRCSDINLQQAVHPVNLRVWFYWNPCDWLHSPFFSPFTVK